MIFHPACHILECCEGLAQSVISTVGQAFELRFKQYLHSPPRVVVPPERYWPVSLSPFPSTPAGPAPPLPWGWILAPSLLCAPHLHGPLLNHEDARLTPSPVLAEERTQPRLTDPAWPRL